MSKHKSVALISGGVESLVTCALMSAATLSGRYGLFVDHGQTAADRERVAARAIARHYGIHLEIVEMDLPFLENCPMIRGDFQYAPEMGEVLEAPVLDPEETARAAVAHIVPLRNLVLVSLAASFADSIDAKEVWLGFDWTPTTKTPDKSPGFVSALQSAITFGRHGGEIRLLTPVQGNTKRDTVAVGDKLGVPWALSWSCYNGLPLACGVCSRCLDRRAAFEGAGIKDGIAYHSIEYVQAHTAV